MTTPTHETRDPDRADHEPETRHRLDLSVTKVAAGACAAALAAAVGSKLGVAGTIVGAAVASAVATSAGALIGHSLERGKTVALKAMPVLDPEQLETAILSRARTAHQTRIDQTRVDHPRIDHPGIDPTRIDPTRIAEPAALTRFDEAQAKHSLADLALTDSGLDETVVLDGATHAALGIHDGRKGYVGHAGHNAHDPMGPHAQTMLLANAADDVPRSWKDRIPGRKPLIAAAVASFLIGTGAVTALEVARKGEFPGYHSNVFTNNPGSSGGSQNQPDPENTGGKGTHEGSTPSQKPNSPSPTPSGSSDSPSTTPSTPQSSDSTPSTPSTPSTNSSTGSTGTSTPPTTSPTGGASPSTVPSTSGGSTQGSSAGGAGKATPSGGAPTG